MTFEEKITSIRKKMKEEKINIYIVYSDDPHKSVSVADHWRCVHWLTGFSGWVGTVLISEDKIAFWTDGRYVEQAKRELSGKNIDKYCIINPEDPTIYQWIINEIRMDGFVGFDGKVAMAGEIERLEKVLARKKASIKFSKNLLEDIWDDRPVIPNNPVFDFDVKYAGEERKEKIRRVREKMKQMEVDFYLTSGLDDIAWLLNLRGSDSILYPVFHGYVLVSMDKVWLFINEVKISEQLIEKLHEDEIYCKDMNNVFKALSSLSDNTVITYDPFKTSILLKKALSDNVYTIEELDLVTNMKCCKNETELSNLRNANIKEDVCVVRLIKYVKDNIGHVKMDEYSVGQWINEERKKNPEFIKPANIPIVGCKGNAAEIHYRPTKTNSDILEPKGLLLFDLCAHYYSGSTDITRTIALGPLTEQMKKDYTLTLKSHIRLATQLFPFGCTGPALDGAIKAAHWNEGLDYGAGTGHGMGYCTYIQEGPCKIAMDRSPFFHYTFDSPIRPGMIFSNEPGVYRKGSHAIRIENTIVTVEKFSNDQGRFLGFDTLSFVPMEKEAVIVSMLTDKELDWLNDYHQKVYEKLSQYLEPEEKEWLMKQTFPLSKNN